MSNCLSATSDQFPNSWISQPSNVANCHTEAINLITWEKTVPDHVAFFCTIVEAWITELWEIFFFLFYFQKLIFTSVIDT